MVRDSGQPVNLPTSLSARPTRPRTPQYSTFRSTQLPYSTRARKLVSSKVGCISLCKQVRRQRHLWLRGRTTQRKRPVQEPAGNPTPSRGRPVRRPGRASAAPRSSSGAISAHTLRSFGNPVPFIPGIYLASGSLAERSGPRASASVGSPFGGRKRLLERYIDLPPGAVDRCTAYMDLEHRAQDLCTRYKGLLHRAQRLCTAYIGVLHRAEDDCT